MKRNPNATCGTCPYWLLSIPEDNIGECHRDNPHAVDPYRRWETTNSKEWCGRHPDFWEAEATEQAALNRIAALINDGDDAEALKELRMMHGLVSRYVCDSCGTASRTVLGMRCPKCGGWVTVRVVIEPKEATQ